MSEREAYSDHEWQTLQFAPLAAFHAVAYADGGISSPESGVFMTKLGQVSGLSVPAASLVREVFESLRDDHARLLQRFEDARLGGVTFDLVLRETKELLDTKAEPAQAKTFRDVIRILCVAIAEAAPIVGLKVTAQEHEAIEHVTAQLG
ncbi:MAG: hypothetical protein JWN29_4022 [Acidimicrobiales bacterium]|nr:hypothetical protein [Acidimicrobiales bacterium]